MDFFPRIQFYPIKTIIFTIFLFSLIFKKIKDRAQNI